MGEHSRPEDFTVQDEPTDLLTYLADVGTKAIFDHPDFDLDQHKVIVCVDDEHRGGIAMIGYEDPNDAIINMFLQLRAIVRTYGGDVALIGIPDDISELD